MYLEKHQKPNNFKKFKSHSDASSNTNNTPSKKKKNRLHNQNSVSVCSMEGKEGFAEGLGYACIEQQMNE